MKYIVRLFVVTLFTLISIYTFIINNYKLGKLLSWDIL